ncbi:MAG: lipopolysaccharide heptosyltransferase I [Gammaproteobacteria bacterium]|nr:lipopolysaccharide heptosyltransferase I [Gammaproteobacteria bacterium]
MRKIAIIKLSSLGDIIHATIVLQFIKKQNPDIKIDWFVDSSFAEIIKDHPLINNVISLPLRKAKKDKTLFIKSYKIIKQYKNKYDFIIDMQGLLKSAIVARILGKNIGGFAKDSIREKIASIFYKKVSHISYTENTIWRYAKLISDLLEIKIDKHDLINKQPIIPYQTKSLEKIREFLNKKPVIIFIIGASWPNKMYPSEKFIELANKLETNILIPYGNNAEKNIAEKIAKKSLHATVVPKLNLSELTAFISQADLVIGGDTGPTYIAWANNIPTIFLFGPTPTERLLASEKHIAIKSPSKINPYKLRRDDFSIKEITVDEVLSAAKKIL